MISWNCNLIISFNFTSRKIYLNILCIFCWYCKCYQGFNIFCEMIPRRLRSKLTFLHTHTKKSIKSQCAYMKILYSRMKWFNLQFKFFYDLSTQEMNIFLMDSIYPTISIFFFSCILYDFRYTRRRFGAHSIQNIMDLLLFNE